MPLKVRVRNFQSIDDVTIVIDGLTVITGTNNAGKSSLVRAIRGAFTNARGAAFVRLGATHCTVDLEDLSDGRTLTWEKGDKGINRYILDGKTFDRVGHGVPPEILAFGVTPLNAGGQDLWPQIASQVNGVMFLLDQPGSVIAEAVADVERVKQLNTALKLSESDRKTAKSNLKIRLKDGEDFKVRRKAFEGLDDVLATLESLKERRDQGEKLFTAHKNLVRLGERYVRAQSDVRELAGIDGIESKLPLEERVVKVKAFRHAIGITVDLALRYEAAKQDYNTAQQAFDVVTCIALDEGLPEKADRVKRGVSKAKDLRDRVAQAQGQLKTLDQEIVKREKELESIRIRATELLGTFTACPTCGGNLDHVHDQTTLAN